MAAIPTAALPHLTGHLKDPVTLHRWFVSVFSRHHSVTRHPGFLSGSLLNSAGLPNCEPASQPSLLFTDLIISGRGERVCKLAPCTPRCVQDPCIKKTAFRALGELGEGQEDDRACKYQSLTETQQAGQEFQFNRDATRQFRPSVYGVC